MNLKSLLRCVHRHDIEHHPNCFQAGNVNQEQAINLFEENGKPWYNLEGLKIGYLDIESDGLKADFATMLSWCIKEKSGEVAYDIVTKDELFTGQGDVRILQSLVAEMQKYAIIVTYYGTGFDLPFIRTKAMHYNLYFPGYVNEVYENRSGATLVKSYPELFHFDLYYTVKAKMCLSRKSLANVCEYLGIDGKTPLKGSTWVKAKYGDAAALQEVLDHNIADVVILEQLHDRLEPFAKWTKKGV